MIGTDLVLCRSIERYEILSDDKDFMFDFTKSDTPIPTRKSFPALTGVGTSLVVGQMPGTSIPSIAFTTCRNDRFLTEGE